jgi:hypothetical protein
MRCSGYQGRQPTTRPITFNHRKRRALDGLRCRCSYREAVSGFGGGLEPDPGLVGLERHRLQGRGRAGSGHATAAQTRPVAVGPDTAWSRSRTPRQGRSPGDRGWPGCPGRPGRAGPPTPCHGSEHSFMARESMTSGYRGLVLAWSAWWVNSTVTWWALARGPRSDGTSAGSCLATISASATKSR